MTVSIGTGTRISATGDVGVSGTVSRTPASAGSVPDGAIVGVDEIADTLTVNFPLATGDQVTYLANGGTIGGLAACTGTGTTCRAYTVTVGSTTVVAEAPPARTNPPPHAAA